MPEKIRKKVVYIIGNLQIGGAEWQMIDTATRLNRDIFLPKIYCLFGGGHFQAYAEKHQLEVIIPQKEEKEGRPVRRQAPFWRTRAFGALYKWLRKERPDIVHCYMYKPSVYGGFAARLAGVPVTLTHRLCLGYFKDQRPFYQAVENCVNGLISGVIANSEAVKRDVLQRERISSEKVHVLHAGVDEQKFASSAVCHSQRVQVKKKFGIPGQATVVGMIATLFPYKGYHEYIQAAASVLSKFPETYFLCIGRDQGIQDELHQLTRELNIQDRIIFTGQLSNIPEVLQILDIQISASYEEGFSSAILEGMAAGKPIVATSVGGTPEAVLHDETGILIPPRNIEALTQALLCLLEKPDRAALFGKNGQKRIEDHFTMTLMLDKLEALYLGLHGDDS